MNDNSTTLMAATILPPDPAEIAGLRRRRILAHLVDAAIVILIGAVLAIPATLLGVLSFGLLAGPMALLLALVPLLYHAFLVSGDKRGTFGHRFAGIKVETLDGRAANFIQAGAHWILFYLTVAFTWGLVLVWSFFNPRKRLLHDVLTGLTVRRRNGGGA